MGIPNLDLFRYMRDVFLAHTFVETGSGRGETAIKALGIFPDVYTSELSLELHSLVKSKIGDRAHCFFGRSEEFLETLLPGILGPIVYWLDAHWSQGPTAGRKSQCPLMEELKIINCREGNEDFIFIDDAHIFFSPCLLKPPLDWRQWPNISDIFRILEAKERYTVILNSFRCAKHGARGGIVFPEDMIVSIPLKYKDQLILWLEKFELEGME